MVLVVGGLFLRLHTVKVSSSPLLGTADHTECGEAIEGEEVTEEVSENNTNDVFASHCCP